MDYCFCTLALRSPYRLHAKNLAEDLNKYAPKKTLIIFSDEPDDFKNYPNILAFKHHQKGIPHCWNDRRFVVEKALSICPVVIHIDADTRILASIPENIEWQPGITAMHGDLLEQANKWMFPPDIKLMQKWASKLDISLEKASWIKESLYIITKDEGREIEFLKQWDIITRTLELKGYTSSDGYCMGMAAQKVGWTVKDNGWDTLDKITDHFYASGQAIKPRYFWNKLQRKLNYYYRLIQGWLIALNDPI